MKRISPFISFLLLCFAATPGLAAFEKDSITTSGGELVITFIKHGSLMFEFQGQIIHVDPVSKMADYSTLPKADIILITHEHGDHLDAGLIGKLRKETTKVILTKTCAATGVDGIIMKNGETREVAGRTIEAVAAYNNVHKRDNGQLFHQKGIGNGYVISFADTRVYVAGDTENIIEMKSLPDIDIAFLPMNLPYTMTPEMVADAAFCFEPKILYPYHYGETDTSEIVAIMKDHPATEVRIRTLP